MKFLMRSTIIFVVFSVHILIGCTKSNNSEKLSPLLEKYIDYWNTGEFTGIEETLHPDFEPEKGIVTFKETVIKWRTAYPDFHIDLNEWIASNDLLWMTQLGFNLIPPKTDSEK